MKMTSSTDPAEEAAHRQLARYKVRHWPPSDQIPGVLQLQEVLGRSDSAIVVLLHIHVYTVGLNVQLIARGRPGQHPSFISISPQMAARMGLPETDPPMHLRVVLQDGTEAVALTSEQLWKRLDDVAGTPVLRTGHGSGKPDATDYQYWLTPAPTQAVTIHFAWPEQGLRATAITIDQAALQRAGGEVIELWS